MEAFTEYRGPADYFHGRHGVINPFVRALEHYRTNKRGTTFLIKGPPGSGKTALLSELSEHAKTVGYTVKDNVKPSDFYSPASMAETLGVSYTPHKENAFGFDVKIFRWGQKTESERQSEVVEIIKKSSSGAGLLLVLDEAQHVAELVGRDDVTDRAMSTLNMLHYGKIGQPVILLAGGLGTAELAFESLGVSRLEDSCMVRLGPLDSESTHAIIKDHLVHRCGLEFPPQNWIESLAEPTHGWPHHIICYVESAKECLALTNQQPTQIALKHALEVGHKRRVSYYEARAHGISRKQRHLIAELFSDLPSGGTVDKEDILEIMEEQYSEKEALEVFDRALRQGVLDEREDGGFAIPIPSMQRWLVDVHVMGNAIETKKQFPSIQYSHKKDRRGQQGLVR